MITKKIALLLAVAGSLPATAAAQSAPDYEAIVRVMRECAKIADVPARVACYDETVWAEARISHAPADASRAAPVAPVTAAPPAAPRATGFGAESLPETTAARAALPDREETRITAIRELRPRAFAFTLADGGQWEFTDQAPLSYDAPRNGDTVVLRRGALGGFMLDYAGQASIRIRRVR